METHETKIICDRCGQDITKTYRRKLCRRNTFWFKTTVDYYDLCDDCDSSFRFHWLKGEPVDGVKKEDKNAGKDSA